MIKLIGTSHHGKLTVLVPKEYDNKELEIRIVSSREKKDESDKKAESNKKAEKLMSLADSTVS